MSCPPNFERSISLNDLDSSLKVREIIQEDIVSPEDETKHCHLNCAAEYTFVLKSFKDLSLDYKKFLYSYLLDVGIFKELEKDKKLNWCPCLFPMVSVLTLADGNCLMHAASIGMWAVNDRYHTLRKLVYNAILEDTDSIFHRRWQREHQLTKLSPHGYKMTEEQWIQEWQIVLQLVSQEENHFGQTTMRFDSLEEIHIFILANVLRRTIIVISSDTLRGNYDESLSPVHFSGIYLPLNWDPVDCVKTPLVIGYSQGHFTSIVSFEDGVFDQGEAMDGLHEMSSKIHGVPLQKQNGTPLPIHFLFENEECLTEGLLRQYLDCKKLVHKDPEDGSQVVTLVAKLHFVPPPNPVKKLVDGFFSRARETYQYMVQTKGGQSAGTSRSLALHPCKTEGCEFFGTSESLFMCSKCLEQHLKSEGNREVFPHPQNKGLSGTGVAFQDEYARGKHISAGTSGSSAYFFGEFPQINAAQQRQIIEQTQQREQQQRLQQQENEHLKQKQQRQQETEIFELQEPHQEIKRLQQQEIDLLQQQQQQQRQEEPQEPNKCITNGCKYKANEETGNLCIRCYESEVMAEQHAASIVSMNLQGKPCANSVNGCKLFGIPQQDDFCSRCYRKFCLKMESNVTQRSEVTPSSSSAVVLSPSAENICVTPECSNIAFPELYDRCIQCYSMCIKTFITSPERSQLSTAALVRPSFQTPPQGPQPQASPAPQVLPSLHGAAFPSQNPLCVVSCCQNTGVPSYNGQCVECHRIKPLISVPNPPIYTTPTRHAPTATAGLPTVEPAEEESGVILYCKKPKCNNPVGESDSKFCTQCIMHHYQQEDIQQPHNLPSSSGSGAGNTENQFSRENLEFELGAFGFGMEKVGLNQPKGSPSEERRKTVAMARQNLPPLQIPPSSAKVDRNSPVPGSTVSTGTPGSNIRCVAPNCPFFGNAEHNYYCSTCYEKSREEWRKIKELAQMRHSRCQNTLEQEPVSWIPRDVTVKPAKMRGCALKYCYNLETPGKKGLCDRCYQTAITSEREWTSTNRARSEPQRQQPIHAPASRASSSKPLKKNFIDTGAPCKTQGCLKFGTAEMQGLCDPCFRRLQRNQFSSISAYGSSSVPVCVAQQKTSLSSNRSNFTKTSAMNTTFSNHNPIPVTQRSSGVGSSNKCKQEGCRMTGTPECGGFCSQCVIDYTRQTSYTESVPDIKDSPEDQFLTNGPSALSPNLSNLTSPSASATSKAT